MRFLIGQENVSAMGADNRVTEGKPQSEAPPAVRNLIGSAVKHIEYVWLGIIRDAWPIVCNFHDDPFPLFLCLDSDFRTFRRIFDGIVHDIDYHLDDKSGVHACQQEFLLALHGDGVLRVFPVDMAQGLRDDLIHQLGRWV